MSVLTDQKNNTKTSNYLFENDFAYVTSEGEVKLKETSLFKEKTLTTVDAESAETQVKAFQKAFENLEAKVENFFSEIEEKTASETKDLEAKFNALVEEITSVDAIGDFEALVQSAKSRLEKLENAKKEDAVDESENEVAEEVDKKDDEVADDESEEKTVKEVEAGDESKEDEPDETEEKPDPEEDDKTETIGETETYYKELADKAEDIVKLTDWAYVSMEFDNIDNQWKEGPDPSEIDIKPYREKIDDLKEQFEEKKKAHYEEQKKIREENLEKKKDLLKDLKEIIEEKKWTHTREVGKIKGKWEQIKPIPSEEEEKLQPRFDEYIATFDEHKVDRLVKKKQQEEDNLTGKLVILEKMEQFVKGLNDDSDWKEADKDFSELTKQFRKIGRIPVEKNREVWGRYHKAQDTFHSMRFKHDKKYREKIEKYLSKKKKLIDEAEALVDADDLADAARKVNKLHRRWKKVGNLPQKDENEMWDRFKAATDAFNDMKSDNIDQLREQEEENYNEKLKLIERAEEIKDSEEWEKTHSEYQKLMDQWKKIGPVPRKKSGKIWKKFKGTMDYFYDRRRDHFKEVKEQRKDNLEEKEDVLSKLKDLKDHEDPIEAVNIAKPLQEEFKKAGYVPIKHKNRMWKEYRETCDVIYDRFRAAKAAVDVVGRENVENYSIDDIADIREKQKEADKLQKEIKNLSSELLQMKESLSYFKPSGGSSPLLDDVKNKIDKAEEKINKKDEKLQKLEIEIDKIKRNK